MDSISINYLGGDEILTHPLYLKWSQLSIANITIDLDDLKTDFRNIEANMNNLDIIAYMSTLIRCVTLII